MPPERQALNPLEHNVQRVPDAPQEWIDRHRKDHRSFDRCWNLRKVPPDDDCDGEHRHGRHHDTSHIGTNKRMRWHLFSLLPCACLIRTRMFWTMPSLRSRLNEQHVVALRIMQDCTCWFASHHVVPADSG